MEINEWIRNVEMGVLAAIEMTRASILESSSEDLNVLEEYQKLYSKIEALCKDQKEFHEHVLERPRDEDAGNPEGLREYRGRVKLEKITQKLENSREYLKECIKGELQNINYIETLSIMWKHSLEL